MSVVHGNAGTHSEWSTAFDGLTHTGLTCGMAVFSSRAELLYVSGDLAATTNDTTITKAATKVGLPTCELPALILNAFTYRTVFHPATPPSSLPVPSVSSQAVSNSTATPTSADGSIESKRIQPSIPVTSTLTTTSTPIAITATTATSARDESKTMPSIPTLTPVNAPATSTTNADGSVETMVDDSNGWKTASVGCTSVESTTISARFHIGSTPMTVIEQTPMRLCAVSKYRRLSLACHRTPFGYVVTLYRRPIVLQTALPIIEHTIDSWRKL